MGISTATNEEAIMTKFSFIKLVLLLTFSFAGLESAFAVGEHCLIKPDQIGTVAQRIFKANKEAGEYFPEQSIVQNRAESQISFKNGTLTTQRDVTFEGYYRPSESTWFSILPIPLFVAQLDRDRNVVYICTHNEENPENSYVIIYFLRGYKISKTTLGTFLGDFLFSSIDVDSINLLPIGTVPFKNFFDKAFNGSAFGSIASAPVTLLGNIQNFVVKILNEFVGLGVQRIIVRDNHVLLESGIDFKNPENARFSRKIPLNEDAK